MNISEPFIKKPVATTLLTAAVALAGAVAFRLLPVSPLPGVDFPTISVSASLPGASPETMASSVATPLERQFGRIAGVTEMTSASGLGSSSITLQFELDRAHRRQAYRDVLAAINAARGNLPTNLPSNPSYRKVNPADSPIFIMTLTSDTLTKGQMYDAASTVLAQKLSQITGVGQVQVGGSSLPSVRIELNPQAVDKYGIGLEQVRTVLASANVNSPKGHFSYGDRTWEIDASDQIFKAVEYGKLIVNYHGGSRHSHLRHRRRHRFRGRPSQRLCQRQALGSADRSPPARRQGHRRRRSPPAPPSRSFKASIPAGINMQVALDQTVTIRASVFEVERTLVISIILVLLVVFFFLRNFRTTFIPSVAVPVSLIGTFGVMYLVGFHIDNLSLMALTISTGFVVDDAIVVIENITRYIEQGMKPYQAALKGAQEIGFTVLTISISLVAVFIPLLLMGGSEGRLFREFAITLSVAIGISMAVSLTTTPMMCAYLLKHNENHGKLYNTTERWFNWVIDQYGKMLNVVLNHSFVTLLVLLATIGLNVYLFVRVPKGFFPFKNTCPRERQRAGRTQDTSFEQMDKTLKAIRRHRSRRPRHGHRHRLHRRRPRRSHQQRPHVRIAQAAR